MKISTNSPLAQFKANWIDFDAGVIVAGEDFQTLLQHLVQKVITTVNGEKLKHEIASFKELAIFKSGVTL